MKYARVLTVLTLVAAAGLAAVALARSSQRSSRHVSPRPTLRLLAQAAAQPWLVAPSLRAVTPLAVPNSGGTCFVGGGACSIHPCVIPVKSAVATVITGPMAATSGCPLGDRVPKAYRVSVR